MPRLNCLSTGEPMIPPRPGFIYDEIPDVEGVKVPGWLLWAFRKVLGCWNTSRCYRFILGAIQVLFYDRRVSEGFCCFLRKGIFPKWDSCERRLIFARHFFVKSKSRSDERLTCFPWDYSGGTSPSSSWENFSYAICILDFCVYFQKIDWKYTNSDGILIHWILIHHWIWIISIIISNRYWSIMWLEIGRSCLRVWLDMLKTLDTWFHLPETSSWCH